MKKILALVLAMVMVLALCACGAKEEAPVEVAAPAAAPAEAAAPDAAAPGAAPATEDTFAAWKEYAATIATAGAPTEEEKTSVAEAIMACATYEEVTAISQMTVLLENNVILSYDAWVEAGMPEADVSNVAAGDPGASGEPSGEPSAEPAA